MSHWQPCQPGADAAEVLVLPVLVLDRALRTALGPGIGVSPAGWELGPAAVGMDLVWDPTEIKGKKTHENILHNRVQNKALLLLLLLRVLPDWKEDDEKSRSVVWISVCHWTTNPTGRESVVALLWHHRAWSLRYTFSSWFRFIYCVDLKHSSLSLFRNSTLATILMWILVWFDMMFVIRLCLLFRDIFVILLTFINSRRDSLLSV